MARPHVPAHPKPPRGGALAPSKRLAPAPSPARRTSLLRNRAHLLQIVMKLLLILLGVGASASAWAPIAGTDFPIAGTDDGPLPMGQQLSTSEAVDIATTPDATPGLARFPVLRSAAKRALNVAQDEAQRENEKRSRSEEEDSTRRALGHVDPIWPLRGLAEVTLTL